MSALDLHRLATQPTFSRRPQPINWLIKLNAAYRERQAMKRLDSAALRDMGLTSEDVDTTTIVDVLTRSKHY